MMFLRNIFRRLFAVLFFVPSWFLYGSSLKKDEEILFFPTNAKLLSDEQWEVSVHAWIYEMEKGTVSRDIGRKLIGEILEFVDVTEAQTQSALFKERIKWFLVDNERNKVINMGVDGQSQQSPRSVANGHIKFSTQVTAKDQVGTWIDIPVNMPAADKRSFAAETQLIPRRGTSVISDIDDTVKISEVMNKKALIQHVFFKDYETTEGMPAFYAELAEQGYYFHYISASPWQLYPSLKPFMEQHYPKGAYSLRHFRVTDSSFIAFMRSSMNYKIKAISNIIQRYPEHRFILIGDSGEKDPEVYAQIYRKFPNNIKKILIRKVAGSALSDARKEHIFEGIPEHRWQFFDTPNMLEAF
ncbi:MAG: Unknown protein [uncultured Thiotrichaceae bacterium]|uniref:Phosphatidate phosphatase APP1 catalytic domain-containing protein n=1 Tax=uncultured Thiotrichaceae bacterium TaxID=298394 RepID=A0A6S6TJI9_9GAMM|nr:MAG: Unknown protein [uncultured Thiotrichaceae bacterium]